jgi:hypothetical protein
VEDVRSAAAQDGTTVVICAAVGPRGDGYRPAEAMAVPEAEAYHRPQIEMLAETSADTVTALTMTSPEEGAGIALAARDAGVPCAISFTVGTDGRLPSGQTLREAVEIVDRETDTRRRSAGQRAGCSPCGRPLDPPVQGQAALRTPDDRTVVQDELAAGRTLERGPAQQREQLLLERAMERGDAARHQPSSLKTPTTLPRIWTWFA